MSSPAVALDKQPAADLEENLLYDLTPEQRFRVYLVTATHERTNRPGFHWAWTHPVLADIMDIPETSLNLINSWWSYSAASVSPAMWKLTLNGLVLKILSEDHQETAVVHWTGDREAPESEIIAWALYYAAERRLILDPAVPRRAEELICQAAQIADLGTLQYALIRTIEEARRG